MFNISIASNHITAEQWLDKSYDELVKEMQKNGAVSFDGFGYSITSELPAPTKELYLGYNSHLLVYYHKTKTRSEAFEYIKENRKKW